MSHGSHRLTRIETKAISYSVWIPLCNETPFIATTPSSTASAPSTIPSISPRKCIGIGERREAKDGENRHSSRDGVEGEGHRTPARAVCA